MADTILQSEVLTKFVYPFLIVFFIVFAILDKTKIFGEGKKQINAFIALIIGLVFVSAAYPKMVVSNMILFFTVALVILFIVLLLWAFVFGIDKDKFEIKGGVKWTLFAIISVAVIVAVLWATGVSGTFWDFLTGKITGAFWTNLIFVILIAAALAIVLATGKK